MSPDREDEPSELIRAVRAAQLDSLKELLAELMDEERRPKAKRDPLGRREYVAAALPADVIALLES